MRHVPASEQGWRGYESLYLPSPLLTKEGNRKTLDPFLDWIPDQVRGQASRMTEGEKQILRFAQNDQWQEWVVVMQSRGVLQEGP